MVINMKKIILYITIISILTGCNINQDNKETSNNNQEQSSNKTNEEEKLPKVKYFLNVEFFYNPHIDCHIHCQ